MSNKKQSPVDFLESIYLKSGINREAHFNQARIDFKEQMRECALSSKTEFKPIREIFNNQFEKWFKETYGY